MKRIILLMMGISMFARISTAQLANTPHKSEFTLELDALSLDIAFARKVSEKMMLGAGIGAGVSLMTNDIKAFGLLELAHARIFIRPYPGDKKLSIEGGLIGSGILFSTDYSGSADLGGDGLIAAYIRPYYGFKNLKFGTQLALGKAIGRGGSLYWTPLLIRYSFRFPKQ